MSFTPEPLPISKGPPDEGLTPTPVHPPIRKASQRRAPVAAQGVAEELGSRSGSRRGARRRAGASAKAYGNTAMPNSIAAPFRFTDGQ